MDLQHRAHPTQRAEILVGQCGEVLHRPTGERKRSPGERGESEHRGLEGPVDDALPMQAVAGMQSLEQRLPGEQLQGSRPCSRIHVGEQHEHHGEGRIASQPGRRHSRQRLVARVARFQQFDHVGEDDLGRQHGIVGFQRRAQRQERVPRDERDAHRGGGESPPFGLRQLAPSVLHQRTAHEGVHAQPLAIPVRRPRSVQ